MSIAQKIIAAAKSYLGQEEITGNKGFKNPAFQKKMQDCGWKIGNSWCAFFTELLWKEGYGKNHPLYATLDQLFSPSATATFANFKGSTKFTTGSKPMPGALAVWRYGNGWQGHIAIVDTVIDAKNFTTIEGNTNNDGSREGYKVCSKKRALGEPFKAKGLNLIAFVYVKED